MEQLTIIKIGGNVIDNENVLDGFLKHFAAIPGKKVLVHGGGKIATETAREQGVEVRIVDGRRITDRAMLKIVTQVYGGLVNKAIVSKLQAHDCNAIGMTGADGNLISAHRRPVKDIDYGFVGDIDEVNTPLLTGLLNRDLVPVCAPLTHDGKGNMLNTNADTIASALATAMSGTFDTRLIYCFEKKGVLQDINDEDSVISKISFEAYQQLKRDGIIANGMIPKLDNAFGALEKGVAVITICSADDIMNTDTGTTLTL